MVSDNFQGGDWFQVALVIIGCSLLIVACWNDVAFRMLPNKVTAGCAVAGLALRLADGTIVVSLLVATLVFVGSFLCWRRGWLGGGDVKLLTACTMLVQGPQVMMLLLLTSLFGGLLAVLYLILPAIIRTARQVRVRPARPASASLIGRVLRIESRRIVRRAPLPYGCAISGAALMLLLAPTGLLGN